MRQKITTMLVATSDGSNVVSFGRFLQRKGVAFTVQAFNNVFAFTYWADEDVSFGS